jgi:hypothetical protein
MKSKKGALGEGKVKARIESILNSRFAFVSPDNKEAADIFVWWDYKALLVEVKSRVDSSKAPSEWAVDQIQAALVQLNANFDRIRRGDVINLHNDYYHCRLDNKDLHVRGLIILHAEENSCIRPSDSIRDIYKQRFPVSVMTYDDLASIEAEIDTPYDLFLYLHDRFIYSKRSDIPLGSELSALGLYKKRNNTFPEYSIDVSKRDYWNEYRTQLDKEIAAREIRYESARIYDFVCNLPNRQSKKLGIELDLPRGLYFDWQTGCFLRRFRAEFGKRLLKAASKVVDGKDFDHFAYQNEHGYWIFFLISNKESPKIRQHLRKLARLKFIIEYAMNSYKGVIFGLAIKTPTNDYYKDWEYVDNIVFPRKYEDDEQLKFDERDLRESMKYWQLPNQRKLRQAREFSDTKIVAKSRKNRP